MKRSPTTKKKEKKEKKRDREKEKEDCRTDSENLASVGAVIGSREIYIDLAHQKRKQERGNRFRDE